MNATLDLRDPKAMELGILTTWLMKTELMALILLKFPLYAQTYGKSQICVTAPCSSHHHLSRLTDVTGVTFRENGRWLGTQTGTLPSCLLVH